MSSFHWKIKKKINLWPPFSFLLMHSHVDHNWLTLLERSLKIDRSEKCHDRGLVWELLTPSDGLLTNTKLIIFLFCLYTVTWIKTFLLKYLRLLSWAWLWMSLKRDTAAMNNRFFFLWKKMFFLVRHGCRIKPLLMEKHINNGNITLILSGDLPLLIYLETNICLNV